ncbi:hypothetical protein QJS10_CPA02g00499 [Acorus calamus]|uniref:AMP-dependent synthetase/ligase domain-containing protein n=1 Tax=Acorus calamus TaxID=4465 RepID=A0AAV9FFL0_ACOCL|nr:hypothetical protein QJS10_CPA02g00499 [Acorus calamus]
MMRKSKSTKQRGLPVDVGGETGYAIRNYRFTSPVATAWEGISTLAELFEESCKKYASKRLLGTQKLISREMEETADGRSFEKLHLGSYERLNYEEVFKNVSNFSSGLLALEHKRQERAAIFADVQRLGMESPIDADLPVSADIAVIMYTSGSTGLPKNVMVAVGCAIGYGNPSTPTDTSNKIKRGTKGDVSVLGPTLMTAVPAILDRVRDGVQKKVDAKGGLTKKLFEIGYRRRLSAINGSWFGAWGLEMILWDFIVFRKVRAVLGGGYLISDSPMPQGEIVTGGPSVTAGYLKNEAKTNEVYKVDERGIWWFYTGDIGQIHPDGCLGIIDRKKNMVEAALIVSPYVDNLMLHADPFRNYCVALVVPSPNSVEDWAQKQGITYTDFSDLCQKEETIKEVYGSLLKAVFQCHHTVYSLCRLRRQPRLQKFEIPSKIKLLPDPWTPEAGLVTAALKLKREVIRKTFSLELSKLYT